MIKVLTNCSNQSNPIRNRKVFVNSKTGARESSERFLFCNVFCNQDYK